MSKGLSRDESCPSSGVPLEIPVVALLASLQFPMLIPHIEISSLDAPFATALGSASENQYGTLFGPVFNHSQYVKKDDFDRMETKIEAFVEHIEESKGNLDYPKFNFS